MAQYTITKWKYSDTHAESKFKDPVEGVTYLKITSAMMDEEKSIYKLIVDDLCNDLSMSLSYFVESVDNDTGDLKPNNMAIGTLESLGTALFAQNVGMPNPVDVVGGVVKGEVKLSNGKANAEGKVRQWPRVYKFEPVPRSIKEGFADIEQYFIEDAEE